MEIKKSKARFLSIFFIVALGVAFFSGIQAASPDMRFSGDAYYDEMSLMDLKVIGTMGLTQEDVDALLEVEGVEKAEGAYFVDVMCGEGENQTVLHVESLNQEMNQLSVAQGRLPQKRGELFLDQAFAEGHGYQVGDPLTLKEEKEGTFLKRKEYTIVGTGRCPMYISFNRGNTTLGTGEVNGFAYLLPQDFDQEIYTQIYLLAHGAKGLTSYTDAYDNLIQLVQERVEGIQEIRCQARYDSVVGDAREELEDARRELLDGKKEAEEKLADAKKELDDGEKELLDGKQEYEDGVKALADARKETQDGRTQLEDARQQVADGWNQIAGARAQAAEGQSQLEAAQSEITSGLAEIEKNQSALDEKKAELKAARQQYKEGKAQLKAAEAQLSEQQAQLDSSREQLAQGRAQLEAARTDLAAKRQECETSLGTVAEGEAALVQSEAALSQAREQAALLIAQRDGLKAQYEGAAASGEAAPEELEALLAQIGALEQQAAAVQGQIGQNAAALDAARQELSQSRAQLAAAMGEIDGGLQALAVQEEQLNGSEAQISQGQAQLDGARAQLEKEKERLASAKEQIDDGKTQIEAGQAEIQKARSQLQEAQGELTARAQQLSAAVGEIDANASRLGSAQAEINANEQKLADAQREIEENEKKLKDAKKDLEDGERELAEGRQEYEDAKQEAEQEISENQQKLEDAEKELEEVQVPSWTVTNRNSLPEYSDYGDNADRIRNIGQVFPVIFFLVAALISLTTMTRMVEEQRTQIGTMKALGYTKRAIAGKYVGYALLATVGGSVLGILIGEKILPYIIITSYGIMYHNVSDSLVIDYELRFAMIASAAAVVCTVGATLFSCGKELREPPASLMRPPAPKGGKRVLVERITIVWKHLSFTWKSTLRNLFRYKKRLFMTIFGIAGSMALLLVGFGLKDSIMDIAVRQYQELQHYEANVIEDGDASFEDREKAADYLKGHEKVDHCMKVQFSKLSAPRGSSSLSVYLFVPEDGESFEKDVTLKNRITGELYQLTDEGAAIGEKTASLLGLELGDSITLEKGGKDYSVKVAVITENYMSHYVYMTPRLYQQTFGEAPDYQNLLFTMKEEYREDIEEVGKELLSMKGALSISYTSSIEGQLERMLSTLETVVLVLIVSAGMLAFVVLYNLNNINITERQRELATLKVLGFYDGEVSQYVFRENLILTLLGVVLGVFFGFFLHRYVITTVEVDAVMFGRSIRPVSYLYSALFTVGFSLFVNMTMHFKLKKINMVESLKSVE
ncbi:MAG: FtsX-like permease family protein [Eubacteriales bacterium]|nr:FtsX-like permease family protein [Eubacteriales bacterium]